MLSPSKKLRLAKQAGGDLPPRAADRQLQERYAYLSSVMKMGKEERRKELLSLSRRVINQPQQDPEERDKLHAFMDKIQRIEAYPTAAIQSQLAHKRDVMDDTRATKELT